MDFGRGWSAFGCPLGSRTLLHVPTFALQSAMPVPAEVLYAWHTRPGAFERLAPTWERLRLLARSGPGVETGTRLRFAVKKGPLWLPWEALHTDHVPGESFTDTQVKGPFASWVHTHRFLPGGAEGSTLSDRVEYRLPGGVIGGALGGALAQRAVERMFAFRHARTRQDLSRHGSTPPMRIVMTGASGAIGRDLLHFLTTGGHTVQRLVRRKPAEDGSEIFWQPGPGPRGGQIDDAALEGCDAVIHLAGAPIAKGRWTPANKEAIRASRVDGTRLISRTLANLKRKPKVLIVASGIHYYGDRGDQEMNEDAGIGSGFLAEVSREWEAADEPAREAGIRTVNLRIGLVVSARGGLLAALLPGARLGLACLLARGTQWWSWIGQDDLLGVILHTLAREDLRGAVNAVTPRPVRMHEFASTLCDMLRRPLFARIPTFALRAAAGERAELVTTSTRAVPEALRRTGFRFMHPGLREALGWELGL